MSLGLCPALRVPALSLLYMPCPWCSGAALGAHALPLMFMPCPPYACPALIVHALPLVLMPCLSSVCALPLEFVSCFLVLGALCFWCSCPVSSKFSALSSVCVPWVYWCSWPVVASTDDVLDAEEDFDDEEGDAGHSYADLAAAMGAPEEEESAEDEEEGLASESEADSGADEDDAEELIASDEEDDDADLGLSDMDDMTDSLDDADDIVSGSASDFSDQEAAEDVNPFELAEATDSEDDGSTKGAVCFDCLQSELARYMIYILHESITQDVFRSYACCIVVRQLDLPQTFVTV